MTGIYALALLLTFGLFVAHTMLIFEFAGILMSYKSQIVEEVRQYHAGKIIIAGCFLFLFAIHVAEATAWALFLRWTRLLASFADGLYFAAVTITALGYGDVVLRRPWRQIGPLVAISGVLMFGCSTAFLFVVMQAIWKEQL